MARTAYISTEFYTGTYHGRTIAAADFDRLALRATEEIDDMTQQRIPRMGGLTELTAADQERVQLATCAIAEWLATEEAMSGATGAVVSSEKVGAYSYTLDASELARARQRAYSAADGFLLFTGLLYAGVIKTCAP